MKINVKENGYFIMVSDAAKMVGHAAGTIESMHEKLLKLGIKPAGYIQGTRENGEKYYRPFYDPDDINNKVLRRAEIKKEIDRLNAELKGLGSD